mgnify:CR=1 FL=1
MSYEFTFKLPTNQIIKDVNKRLSKKVRYIKNDSDLYGDISIDLATTVEHRIPKKSGTLRSSADIITTSSGGYALQYDPVDKYGRHYGEAQYFSPPVGSTIWKRHTPGTGGHWFNRIPIKLWNKYITQVKKEVIASWKRAK